MDERYRNDAEYFANNLWEFQGGDFDFDSIAVSSTGSDDSITGLKPICRKVKPVPIKVSNRDKGYKIRIHGKRRHITDKSVMTALCRSGLKPNVSRRPPSNILYAFPNFDKCDSLLYFPSTMTRHLNTGDMTALTKLFYTHLDRNCDIMMGSCFNSTLNVQQLLNSYELLNDLQPDRIMCVHSTKVVDNQILASIHMKFTDCKAIYDSVAYADLRRLHSAFTGNRTEDMKRRLESEDTLPAHIKQEYIGLVETAVDFVMYVHLSMVFTFDDVSKKVIAMTCEGRLSSMHAVEAATRDLCDI